MSTLQLGYPSPTENIADKRTRSHQHLFRVAVYLERVIESLEFPESHVYWDNILDYMYRVQEVVSKYVKVYFDYNMNHVSNILADESEKKAKIITLCKLIIAVTKYIKVRINVIIKDNAKAHDIIHSIFGMKINWRIQEYLVTIDYWGIIDGNKKNSF